MRIGAVFPTTEIGNDADVIRNFAAAVEEIGYHHLVAYDHVLGANADSAAGRKARYTHRHAFHEPFVLFGYLAAATRHIELFTGIIVLPQRQTALVAKQAAEVDVLSGGRLRLGVAVGPNAFEYEALGADFRDRGRRIEEQIALLRRLWCEPLVEFAGDWHRVGDAGLNPLPIQQPIPIWLGGRADPVLHRVARMAEGWYALDSPGSDAQTQVAKLHAQAREAGRDPASIGIEARIPIADRSPDRWAADARWWHNIGASHVSLHTMDAGFGNVSQHLDALQRFWTDLEAM